MRQFIVEEAAQPPYCQNCFKAGQEIGALREALRVKEVTIGTVVNLLTKDRPVCPKDLTESGRYELVIETAVELLRDVLSTPSPASPKQEDK